MPRKKKQDDVLTTLLEAAPPRTVLELVVRLAATRPDVRRECFDYLKKHVTLSAQQKKQSAGEILLAFWSELAPDLDELRLFVAQRAKVAGNRERYLELQFAHTTDHLTCDKYKAFRKLCTKAEWRDYEEKILAQLKDAWDTEQLRIHMHRKEYEAAVAVLTRGRYPLTAWDSHYELQTAKRLENRFPEEILKYYVSGLGNMKTKAVRKEYTQKAKVMAKIRHLLVEVLNDKARWRAFAIKIKQDNLKRPAFQEEFAKVVPGWGELK